jgi:hypothetical protein
MRNSNTRLPLTGAALGVGGGLVFAGLVASAGKIRMH